MKKLLVCALVAAAPAAMAQANNVGSCGWGSKLFEGQRGVFAQVLAATTNNTSSNTFSITTGTSGCTSDGLVTSGWRTAMFIDGTRLALARDAAAGQGESLDALMTVMAVKPADQDYFKSTLKARFATVFGNENIAANLKSLLASDTRLAAYANTL
ncbi:MAG TPA: DUF3015 family protein [Burkholderiaceae bacterium]|nr:DUF3015 family protein [Burkholderiaceae bacterium]